MSWNSEMCEIIPGLLLGNVRDVEKMVLKGADVLVPLAYLDGNGYFSFRLHSLTQHSDKLHDE